MALARRVKNRRETARSADEVGLADHGLPSGEYVGCHGTVQLMRTTVAVAI